MLKLCLMAVVVLGTLVGYSTTSAKAADVSESIRISLDQAGLKTVSVSQGGDKDVVILGGHVATDDDKARAVSIARSIAGDQVGVKDRIVTLTGEVDSQSKRRRAEEVASAVPNVQQVVNAVQVKEPKAAAAQ
ncbi:MAG: BON domain-containing protein [Bryobacteraceae bacterium]